MVATFYSGLRHVGDRSDLLSYPHTCRRQASHLPGTSKQSRRGEVPAEHDTESIYCHGCAGGLHIDKVSEHAVPEQAQFV